MILLTPCAFAQKTVTREKPLVAIDIGGSGGSYNGYSYSELNLGLNLNFTEWFTWRNAAFKRFSSKTDNDFTGLDSTLRLISTTPFSEATLQVFAGAGYRFASPAGKNALIGEGGLGFNFGHFGLGLGGKYLKYDKTQLDSTGLETKKDDVSYFVTFAIGTGLIF